PRRRLGLTKPPVGASLLAIADPTSRASSLPLQASTLSVPGSSSRRSEIQPQQKSEQRIVRRARVGGVAADFVPQSQAQGVRQFFGDLKLVLPAVGAGIKGEVV